MNSADGGESSHDIRADMAVPHGVDFHVANRMLRFSGNALSKGGVFHINGANGNFSGNLGKAERATIVGVKRLNLGDSANADGQLLLM